MAGWIVCHIDSASNNNRNRNNNHATPHHGHNNSTRMTATPHYVTRWHIHPNMTSQLCCRRCHRAPLTIKKQQCSPFGGCVVSWALSATRMFASTACIQSDEPPKPPCPIDDSTSALNFKGSHKVRPLLLPEIDVLRSW